MIYRPTPKDTLDVIVELINDHVRNLGARFPTEHYTAHDTVGQFTNLAGATVEVRALAKFDRERFDDRKRSVAVGAAARCHGYGCAGPNSGDLFADAVPLDTNRWDAAAKAEPHLQKAREWAQAHAEKCRAQQYTGH